VAGWTARDVTTNKLKTVNETLFQEVAAFDTDLVANYVPITTTTDPAIGAPQVRRVLTRPPLPTTPF
jgi:hypothetical protein